MASGSKKRGGGLGGGHLLGIFFVLAMVMGVVFTLGYLLGRSQYDPQLRAAVVDIAGNPVAAARAKLTAEKSSSPARRSEPVEDDKEDAPAPKGADWDYYHAAEPAKAPARLQPQPESQPSSRSSERVSVRASERASRKTQAGSGANPPQANSPQAPAKPKAQSGSANGSGKNPPPSPNPPLIPRGSIILQVAALAHESDALRMAQALRQKKFPAFVLSPDADKLYRVQVGPYADAKAAAAARERLEKQGFKTIIKR